MKRTWKSRVSTSVWWNQRRKDSSIVDLEQKRNSEESSAMIWSLSIVCVRSADGQRRKERVDRAKIYFHLIECKDLLIDGCFVDFGVIFDIWYSIWVQRKFLRFWRKIVCRILNERKSNDVSSENCPSWAIRWHVSISVLKESTNVELPSTTRRSEINEQNSLKYSGENRWNWQVRLVWLQNALTEQSREQSSWVWQVRGRRDNIDFDE